MILNLYCWYLIRHCTLSEILGPHGTSPRPLAKPLWGLIFEFWRCGPAGHINEAVVEVAFNVTWYQARLYLGASLGTKEFRDKICRLSLRSVITTIG